MCQKESDTTYIYWTPLTMIFNHVSAEFNSVSIGYTSYGRSMGGDLALGLGEDGTNPYPE